MYGTCYNVCGMHVLSYNTFSFKIFKLGELKSPLALEGSLNCCS